MFLGFALSTVCALRAQEVQPSAGPPLTSVTELVNIPTSVLDNRGNFLGGLTSRNFRVLDNGVEQPISIFLPVDSPARVLVLMETSPAVFLIHDQHVIAAYALLDGLAADDEVALATYDRSPRQILGFSADKPELLQALSHVQYTIGMGDLNFYDSVSKTLDWLGPPREKRALVILTTGLDSSTPSSWENLVGKLHRDDVVVFAVALGGSLRPAPPRASKKGAAPESAADESFARADSALRSLAAITGGRVYFPQSEKDFVAIYHEIASALRHQYVIGIAPARDGQFHRLTVEPLDATGQSLNPPSKKSAVRVFAREGYLAPGP